MSKLRWLFPKRKESPPAVDGAVVLDRLERRLGAPVRGDARLILAGQLDRAVSRILELPSLAAAALAAKRESDRIVAMLPRGYAVALRTLLADELVRTRPVEREGR